MSVATIEDYGNSALEQDNKQIHDERARILNMVSQKAQDQTLTLQETTALYEKFNQTYTAYRSTEPQEVDESWALELLQESEQEEAENTTFQTRINGTPHQTKKGSGKDNPANDSILVDNEMKPMLAAPLKEMSFEDRASFIRSDAAKQDKAMATIIVASGLATLSILLGFALAF